LPAGCVSLGSTAPHLRAPQHSTSSAMPNGISGTPPEVCFGMGEPYETTTFDPPAARTSGPALFRLDHRGPGFPRLTHLPHERPDQHGQDTSYQNWPGQDIEGKNC